ncbi:MAG: hypothetical protein L3J30_02365 [Marinosulfonomonas sp.]|nr:hypothetical protein [Marinosulfonomonas sp.]
MPIYVESRGIAHPWNPLGDHEYLVYIPLGDELDYTKWRTIGALPDSKL